jgi:hypothetical protein
LSLHEINGQAPRLSGSHFAREPLKAQFRIEALNLTNHPNFRNPDSGVTDPDFGLITSTDPGSRLIAEHYFRLGFKLLF